MMKNVKLSQKLTESALMLALGTILSLIKIIDLPNGGSITLSSMLPLIIISYRYGFTWGMLSGATFGLLQMLFGLKNLSYATSFIAAVAIILLDYIVAFMATCVGGWFRGIKDQKKGLFLASILTCAIRFLCHFVSGVTIWSVWAPYDPWLYSLVYNISYMLPEMIITAAFAVYLGSALDFRKPALSVIKKEETPKEVKILSAISGAIVIGTLITVISIVFGNIIDGDSGKFDFNGIFNVNFVVLGVVVALSVLSLIGLHFYKKTIAERAKTE